VLCGSGEDGNRLRGPRRSQLADTDREEAQEEQVRALDPPSHLTCPGREKPAVWGAGDLAALRIVSVSSSCLSATNPVAAPAG